MYKWAVTDKYATFIGVTAADERKLSWDDAFMGDPLPSIANWISPRLSQYLPGKAKAKKIGDSPGSSTLNLVSQHAVDVLKDIFDKHSSLYPVELEGADKPYYMVVAKMIDALDRVRSTGKIYSHQPNLFAPVETWVFKDSLIQDVDLFTVPDSVTCIYVSQKFKDRVVATKLKGFCFKTEFWGGETFVS